MESREILSGRSCHGHRGDRRLALKTGHTLLSDCSTSASLSPMEAFSNLVEAIATRAPSWDVFAWCGTPSVDHFALPLSPASYSTFEADIGKDRVGVQDFAFTTYGLSLKSLPPIPMEFCSVAEGPGRMFLINLKPRLDKESSLGRYRNLVVECGMTHLETIRRTRQLSACIINHHGAQSRKEGKLMVGKDYICLTVFNREPHSGSSGSEFPMPFRKRKDQRYFSNDRNRFRKVLAPFRTRNRRKHFNRLTISYICSLKPFTSFLLQHLLPYIISFIQVHRVA